MGPLGPLAVSPALYKNLPYGPVKSFAPVSLMAMVPSVLVVNPQVPAASAGELIAYARANPGKLTYGSAGSGSTSRSEEHTSELQSPDHLVCRLLLEQKKLHRQHLMYLLHYAIQIVLY